MINKYNNPRLHNTVLTGPGMTHPRNPHVVIGSDEQGFIQGDLMDANAIMETIDQKTAELVDSAPEALDTFKELAAALNDDSNFATTVVNAINQKQDALVSGENIKTINGSSILGEGNIVLDTSTYKGLPETWDTTHSMAELIASINADSNAVPGKSYLGTVSLSDLPAGMVQAELIIDIMDQLDIDGDKVIVFSLSSADISPYKWEYTSAYGRLGAWRSWVIEQQQADWNQSDTTAKDYIKNKPTIPTVPTNVSSFNNDAGYLTSHQSLSGYATESWVGQQGYLTSHQDITGKEDKTVIEAASGATLTAQVGKYYTLSNVGTLAITLPTCTGTKTQSVMFYMSTGSTPAVTFTSTHNIYYADGFEIESGSTYEVNALWNGAAWIVASVTIIVE